MPASLIMDFFNNIVVDHLVHLYSANKVEYKNKDRLNIYLFYNKN